MNTVSGGMFPRGLLGPADSVSVIDNCRPFTCSSNRLARRGLAILSLCASRVKDGKNGKKEGKRREWLYAWTESSDDLSAESFSELYPAVLALEEPD